MAVTIADWVDQYVDFERGAGQVLSVDEHIALAVAATRTYLASQTLRSDPEGVDPTVDDQTMITTGEWSLIRPLFLLYVERETAIQLEASRVLGVEPWGRSSSEIASEIVQYENDLLPRRAFFSPMVSV